MQYRFRLRLRVCSDKEQQREAPLSDRKQHSCFGADAYVSTWDAPVLPGRKGYAQDTPWIQPVLAIYREHNGEKMYCLSNFSDREVEVQLPTVHGIYQDLFNEEMVNPENICMQPWQYRWIVKK